MTETRSDEFSVYLISTASMDIFSQNTMAIFINRFQEPIILNGDWRVALTEITFPSEIKNVTDTSILVYSAKDGYTPSSDTSAIAKPRRGKPFDIAAGMYPNVESLMDAIQLLVPISFNYQIDSISKRMTLEFNENEGLAFESSQIPSLLGFDGVSDNVGSSYVHLGYKQGFYFEPNKHTGNFPIDITAGTHSMLVYTDIINYQYVGDTKAPVLRIIDCGRRLKNGSTTLTTVSTLTKKSFSILEYKKLLKSTIDSIKIELRTDIGSLIPFVGTGKVFLTLNFKKFD